MKPNTTCRVCGKTYFCCIDSKNIGSWRSMACTPECFQEYMRRIEESRNPKIEIENTEETTNTVEEIIVEEPTNEIKKNQKKNAFQENNSEKAETIEE